MEVTCPLMSSSIHLTPFNNGSPKIWDLMEESQMKCIQFYRMMKKNIWIKVLASRKLPIIGHHLLLRETIHKLTTTTKNKQIPRPPPSAAKTPSLKEVWTQSQNKTSAKIAAQVRTPKNKVNSFSRISRILLIWLIFKMRPRFSEGTKIHDPLRFARVDKKNYEIRWSSRWTMKIRWPAT